jgi:RNA polymerase sigma factor (TIGR02999 family)
MPISECMSAPGRELSEQLVGWYGAGREDLDRVFTLIYTDLRRLARQHLRQYRPNHTLQPTALVHEAYLRLLGQHSVGAEDHAHVIGVAAQLMRWICVDYERKRRAAKRGAGCTLVLLDEATAPATHDLDLLALHDALEGLAALDSQQVRIVELRCFGGLSIEETAAYLGVSTATVKRSWASARAWLLRELSSRKRP